MTWAMRMVAGVGITYNVIACTLLIIIAAVLS